MRSVKQLRIGQHFRWCSRVVRFDHAEVARGRRRAGRWLVCHEVTNGMYHRLHYYDDEKVELVSNEDTPRTKAAVAREEGASD